MSETPTGADVWAGLLGGRLRRRLVTTFFADYDVIRHGITNLVVDVQVVTVSGVPSFPRRGR